MTPWWLPDAEGAAGVLLVAAGVLAHSGAMVTVGVFVVLVAFVTWARRVGEERRARRGDDFTAIMPGCPVCGEQPESAEFAPAQVHEISARRVYHLAPLAFTCPNGHTYHEDDAERRRGDD